MKPFYTIMFIASVTLLTASIVALAMYGLNFGVDFTGGSVLNLEFAGVRPTAQEVEAVVSKLNNEKFSALTAAVAGERDMVIHAGLLDEEAHQALVGALKKGFPAGDIKELSFDSVGPSVGTELRDRSVKAIVILLLAVLAYIAYMFRALSRTLSLWAMSVGTLLGLIHDIVIPMGVFAVLGKFAGVEIDAVFVAAVLTVLGYTVSDKVVIYDRVRENVLRGSKEPLADLVHHSVMQTLVRSINNTLVVMLTSLAVFLFGGDSIRYFALALMLGIGLGAYSSIFVAAPILVWMGRRKSR